VRCCCVYVKTEFHGTMLTSAQEHFCHYFCVSVGMKCVMGSIYIYIYLYLFLSFSPGIAQQVLMKVCTEGLF
jgi:hypothetical protein